MAKDALDYDKEIQRRRLTWPEIIGIGVAILLVIFLFAIPMLFGWDAPNT
ncbi:MAG TPA: hypothetical protein VN723_15095 [Rhizomicrobium sp.]|nr:hypothetical protein [Rhizomicrobium sp.]